MSSDTGQEMRSALERNFARRMKVARIRLVLWPAVILIAHWLWPHAWWIKWLFVIPLISLLAMGAGYLRLKREIGAL